MRFSITLLFCLLLLLTGSIFAQKEREKGLEYYKKGDYESAIKYLTLVQSVNKKDGDFWYLLGMAYFKISQFNASRIAFEKAVRLKPQNPEFRTNLAVANLEIYRLKQAEKDAKKAIALDPKNVTPYYIRGLVFLRKGKFDKAIADADQSISLDKSKEGSYLLKSDAILYKFGMESDKGIELAKMIEPLQKSIENLETCLVNCTNNSALVKTKLDDSRIFYDYFLEEKKLGNISNDDSNITSLSLLAKPKANYTDSARQAQVQGTITLAVFFSADGNTKKILVLNPLSNGLTEQAILAAQKIKFTPQMNDGKTVSVVKLVQYTFTLY